MTRLKSMRLFFLLFAGSLLHSGDGINGMPLNDAVLNVVGSVTLTLKLSGSKALNGYAMVAVFDDADKFLTDDAVLKERIATSALKDGYLKLQLPPGRYAIAVFIDANNNGKLDRNMFRYPTELYGFSNNVKGYMGPPSFDDAALSLKSDLEIEIELN